MYDLAIIGGGPAGATLARLLGMRYRILLVDKRFLDVPPDTANRGKCCGGLLSPHAQQVLAEMGLAVPHAVLADPQLFAVRTIDVDHRIEQYYQRFYLNCHRELFDRWLASLIPETVDTCYGYTLKNVTCKAEGIEIILSSGSQSYTAHARLLIGADGAHSMVRKLLFPSHPAPRAYLAVQEWCEIQSSVPYFAAIFDRNITDFYSWVIPKGEQLVIGSALQPHEIPLTKFTCLKETLQRYDLSPGKCIRREGGMLLRPSTLQQLCLGDDRIFLIGEAAGWISPTSAEGFSYAFHSAIALAESLCPGLEGAAQRNNSATTTLRRGILGSLVKSPFMYHPRLRSAFLHSGIGSLKKPAMPPLMPRQPDSYTTLTSQLEPI